MTLNELKEKGYINDLYDNKAIHDGGHYSDEDTVNKGNLFTFSYHQYGSVSKERFNQVKNFLDSVLPKESNWYETMFNRGHEPNIGIYDADKNRLLSVGIGRKNRMFYYCTDESFDLTYQGREFSKYSEKDPCDLLFTIMAEFESVADLHTESFELTPWELEAWFNDEDEKEPTDDEQAAYDEEMEDLFEQMDEKLQFLAMFVPDLPDSMGDISPGDF
jgi:hypothetical protein